jgi:hypothetical protein
MYHKLRLGAIIIIIRNRAKVICLTNYAWEPYTVIRNGANTICLPNFVCGNNYYEKKINPFERHGGSFNLKYV